MQALLRPQLYLEEYMSVLHNAGLRSTADLARVSSPDELPDGMPRVAKRKLAAYAGWNVATEERIVGAAAPGTITLIRQPGEPWGLCFDEGTLLLSGILPGTPASRSKSLQKCVGMELITLIIQNKQHNM